jgi:hypothetical protein
MVCKRNAPFSVAESSRIKKVATKKKKKKKKKKKNLLVGRC